MKRTRERYLRIINLLLDWAKEYKFSSKWPFEKLTVKEACKEEWVSENSFYVYMKSNPSLYKKYQFSREVQRDVLKERAQSNLEKILWWELEVENKELWRLSLDVLKSIEKAYNPKQEIDITNNEAISLSMDEIIWRIDELKNK